MLGLRFRDYVEDLSNSGRVHEGLVFAEQIRQHEGSHFWAAIQGGPQFIGWDEGREIAAFTSDLLLAIMSALGGKKLSPGDLYSRPQKEEQHVGTIAEFNTLAFMRMIGGG